MIVVFRFYNGANEPDKPNRIKAIFWILTSSATRLVLLSAFCLLLFEIVIMRDCPLFPFFPLPFLAPGIEIVENAVAVSDEILQGGHDDHRVNVAVELSVVTELEAIEEQHQFSDFQPVVPVSDAGSEFAYLHGGKLAFASAELAEVVELRREPCLSRAVAVSRTKHTEGGSRACDASFGKPAILRLPVRIEQGEAFIHVTEFRDNSVTCCFRQ